MAEHKVHITNKGCWLCGAETMVTNFWNKLEVQPRHIGFIKNECICKSCEKIAKKKGLL